MELLQPLLEIRLASHRLQIVALLVDSLSGCPELRPARNSDSCPG